MKARILKVFVILLSIILTGCSGKGRGYEERPPRTIKVVDATTSQPLQGASVLVMAASNKSGLSHHNMEWVSCSGRESKTNIDGEFIIDSKCTSHGHVNIHLHKPGIGSALFSRTVCDSSSSCEHAKGALVYSDTKQVPEGMILNRSFTQGLYYFGKQLAKKGEALILPLISNYDIDTPFIIGARKRAMIESCKNDQGKKYWFLKEIGHPIAFLVRPDSVGLGNIALADTLLHWNNSYRAWGVEMISLEDGIAKILITSRNKFDSISGRFVNRFAPLVAANLLELPQISKVTFSYSELSVYENTDFPFIEIVNCAANLEAKSAG